MCYPKINVNLVKISYFFPLHDRDMQTTYIAFFNTHNAHLQQECHNSKFGIFELLV
jgi:hypothetical protein